MSNIIDIEPTSTAITPANGNHPPNNQFPIVGNGKIGTQETQTINARDLHKFLESKRQFANWIQERIQQYDFVEGRDYVVIEEVSNNFVKKPSGGRPSKEYHISLDMAKELSMVERNEKGRQARAYFIECERRAKSPIPAIDFSDPQILLGVVNHLQIEVSKKDEIIAGQTERLKKLDRLECAQGSMCISDAAKTLKVQVKWLFQFMQSRRWIFKRVGNKSWLAYDDKRKSGYMEHDDHIYFDKEGNERVSTRALVTAKGLVKLAELIEQPLH